MIPIVLTVLQKIKPFILQMALIVIVVVLAILLYNSNKEANRQLSNYNAQVYATQFWQTKSGDNVARAAVLTLTNKEIKRSKDKEIVELKEVAKDAGLKIRKLQQMLSIKADTVFEVINKVDTIRDSADRLVYIDTLSIGDLHIKRVQDVLTLQAKYTVRYNPTIYIYVSWVKEDKWKLKNLFVPRTKTYYVDVITKDKLLNVVGVKAIVK